MIAFSLSPVRLGLPGHFTSESGMYIDGTIIGAAAFQITGFTLLWSIRELFEQKKCVDKGWFPENPFRREKR